MCMALDGPTSRQGKCAWPWMVQLEDTVSMHGLDGPTSGQGKYAWPWMVQLTDKVSIHGPGLSN